MLTKTVPVARKNYTWSIEENLLVSHSSYMRQIEGKCISSGYIAYIAPLALLCFLTVNFQYCCNSKSKCRFWHQVSNNTFVSFTTVNQSELFNSVYFNSNTILQNILKLLTYCFITIYNLLLKVCGMRPSNLNRSGCLGYMCEDSYS